MYDDIWCPEVIHHVSPNIDLPLGPISGRIQDHSGFGPQQFVGEAKADLLEEEKNESLENKKELFVALMMCEFRVTRGQTVGATSRLNLVIRFGTILKKQY